MPNVSTRIENGCATPIAYATWIWQRAARPAAILRDLDLRRPIYENTAAYGHFGREDRDFAWERTDKADVLRAAAGLGNTVLA